MNTNQPPYGPGFRNAHLAEQTRLLKEHNLLLRALLDSVEIVEDPELIAKALEKDKS